MTAQQQSLETLLGISSQRKSLKQQLDAASIKAESGRTTLTDPPTVQIGCNRSQDVKQPEIYISDEEAHAGARRKYSWASGNNSGICTTTMVQPPAHRVRPRPGYGDRNRQQDGGHPTCLYKIPQAQPL
ncbi:hypothetical protein AUP68_16952 [Ilyonectria robusta]